MVATLDLVQRASAIVQSYVGHNAVPVSELPALIHNVHDALRRLEEPEKKATPPLSPPVSVKKSMTPDYLISLEDGKRYRALKRHLTKRGMTPDQYRTKWGLPPDYPMVAPAYSAQRSQMARSFGLGQKRAKVAKQAPARKPSRKKAQKVEAAE